MVREPVVWQRTLAEVSEAAARAGVTPLAVMASPVIGPAGNVEFLLHGRKGIPRADVRPGPDLDAAVAEGVAIRG